MDQTRAQRLTEILEDSERSRKPVVAIFQPLDHVLPQGSFFNVGAAYLYATVRAPTRQRAGELRRTTLYSGTDELPEMPEVPVIVLDAQPLPVVLENNRLLASVPENHEFDVLTLPSQAKPYITVTASAIEQYETLAAGIEYIATLDVGFPSGQTRTYWLAGLRNQAEVVRYLKQILLQYLEMPGITPAHVEQLASPLTPTQMVHMRLDEPPYKLVLQLTHRSAFTPLRAN